MQTKIISYSLFKGSGDFTELFYVRGFYLNVLMNSLVYPDWRTEVHIDQYVAIKYSDLFQNLIDKYGVGFSFGEPEKSAHCTKMLWRMKPVFWPDVTHVICRDADALTSYREACAVQEWVNSVLVLHGLHDNPGHSIPLMGGMCGFKSQGMIDQYDTWDNMISKAARSIDGHGTDQHFLNDVVYKDFKDSYLNCGTDRAYVSDKGIELGQALGPRSHPSDLCTSFIGAAGCNEFETLRFFRDHLPNWGSDKELWAKYPKLFYWHE